ncbi:GNAT family N-acetyltransferase [Streptomyces mirabilis]|uniref:GNAT family N-acetyltransferase n=1 Tax=Streptomyces mirabilis TaxID=68239 RepID=A0ABU3V5B1_9ACTN|nr:GNAT family N-acetyltransferase [Streptomyces mirabilis]MCX5355704.1 GNAT family N-acetyltransferase [Streptomyces mirabilis]MDU9001347.1 GNAT family N-acetyltransferase [Streptomyces mirabilis]
MPTPAPAAGAACPADRHKITTRGGARTTTRAAALDDHEMVSAMHARSSPQSRYSRYQTGRRNLTLAEWAGLIKPDHGLSWVTCAVDDPSRVVAVSHLLFTDTAGVGELGVLVEDAWQTLGLGTALVRHALAQAQCLGLHTVLVVTDSSNHRMRGICRRLGARTLRVEGNVVDLALPVPDRSPTRGGDRSCRASVQHAVVPRPARSRR